MVVRTVWLPDWEKSTPLANICPASRANWMVSRVRIMLTPIAPVPSISGTSTNRLSANSIVDTPRFACRFIKNLLRGRSDRRRRRRRDRLDDIRRVNGHVHRGGIHRRFPAEEPGHHGHQWIGHDRDLHEVPAPVARSRTGDVRLVVLIEIVNLDVAFAGGAI